MKSLWQMLQLFNELPPETSRTDWLRTAGGVFVAIGNYLQQMATDAAMGNQSGNTLDSEQAVICVQEAIASLGGSAPMMSSADHCACIESMLPTLVSKLSEKL